jgi:K+-sensing histidine kinase KdpD
MRSDWKGYTAAAVVVAAATAIGWPLYHKFQLANTNVLMLYLLAVLWIATRYSRGAAIAASVLGVLAFDFSFVPPYYTFNVHDEQYLVTFAVMLLTAVTISTLTHRLRSRAQEAREAWERAEAEFLRNTLLSGVSHELRTPLAAITGAASALIESENLSPHARAEMLDTIRAEAERMERLITNLLDMTRMESGAIALKREWQPLQEVVGSALRHLDRRLRGREITTDVAPDLPLVQIDSVAIEQVLINLVDNAVEHTPPATPIEIRAHAQDGAVAVEVADRGPGLPPGAETRVFEKFFRAHSAEGRHGIGLGLAIARGLVQLHGGQIHAVNRPAGGAVFDFTIPITGMPPLIDASA